MAGQSKFCVPDNVEWDRLRLAELCIDKAKNPPEGFEQIVLRNVGTNIQARADIENLVVYLQTKGILTDRDIHTLTNPIECKMDRAGHLLQILMVTFKRRTQDPLNGLYLSLRDSYEGDNGMSSHYYIAKELRDKVLCVLNLKEEQDKHKDLSRIIENIVPVELPEVTARSLAQNLGVEWKPQLYNIIAICQHWLKVKSDKCSLPELVQAMMNTRGVGRYVTDLYPICMSNPPEAWQFFSNLPLSRWKNFAQYFGYSHSEIEHIEDAGRPLNPESQFQMFLRVWRMPDCGKKTGTMLDDLKKLLGLGYAVKGQRPFDAEKGVTMQGQGAGPHVPLHPPSIINNVQQIFHIYNAPTHDTAAAAAAAALPPPGHNVPWHPQATAYNHQEHPLAIGSGYQGNSAFPDTQSVMQPQSSRTMEMPGLYHDPTDPHAQYAPGTMPAPLSPFKASAQPAQSAENQQSEPFASPLFTESVHIPKNLLQHPEQVVKMPRAPTVASSPASLSMGSEARQSSEDTVTAGHSIPPTQSVGGTQTFTSSPAVKVSESEGTNGVGEPQTQTHHFQESEQGVALVEACVRGDWQFVIAVIESAFETGHGPFLDTCSKDGKRPIHYAAMKGMSDIVRLLIAKGADPTAVDKVGNSILHFPEILQNGELTEIIVQAFTEKKKSVDIANNESYNTPLMVAAVMGDATYRAAELLLTHGSNPNGNSMANSKPLIVASGGGHCKLVQLLLTYGADLNPQDRNGSTPLLNACSVGQLNVARILLGNTHVNVNRADHDGMSPIFAAASVNAYDIVKLLIEKGATVNATRYRSNPLVGGSVEETPLAHVCARGFQKIADLLIKSGAHVNYMCSNTVPPIGFAIICRQNHIVKFLLKNNDLDKTPHGLQAPIVIAVKVENVECTKWLLAELGGPENALQRAQENQLEELVTHITLFLSSGGNQAGRYERVSNETTALAVNSRTGADTHLLSAEKGKVEEILYTFCHICVQALITGKISMSQDDLISIAQGTGNSEVAKFFQKCFNNTQSQLTLRQDFLGGSPSPSAFLNEYKILESDHFQMQALEYYQGEPEEFYESLVWAFHEVNGGQNLPWDIQGVLRQYFSGGFKFSVTSVSALNHWTLQGSPYEPSRELMSHTCYGPQPLHHEADIPTSGLPESSFHSTINGVPVSRESQREVMPTPRQRSVRQREQPPSLYTDQRLQDARQAQQPNSRQPHQVDQMQSELPMTQPAATSNSLNHGASPISRHKSTNDPEQNKAVSLTEVANNEGSSQAVQQSSHNGEQKWHEQSDPFDQSALCHNLEPAVGSTSEHLEHHSLPPSEERAFSMSSAHMNTHSSVRGKPCVEREATGTTSDRTVIEVEDEKQTNSVQQFSSSPQNADDSRGNQSINCQPISQEQQFQTHGNNPQPHVQVATPPYQVHGDGGTWYFVPSDDRRGSSQQSPMRTTPNVTPPISQSPQSQISHDGSFTSSAFTPPPSAAKPHAFIDYVPQQQSPFDPAFVIHGQSGHIHQEIPQYEQRTQQRSYSTPPTRVLHHANTAVPHPYMRMASHPPASPHQQPASQHVASIYPGYPTGIPAPMFMAPQPPANAYHQPTPLYGAPHYPAYIPPGFPGLPPPMLIPPTTPYQVPPPYPYGNPYGNPYIPAASPYHQWGFVSSPYMPSPRPSMGPTSYAEVPHPHLQHFRRAHPLQRSMSCEPPKTSRLEDPAVFQEMKQLLVEIKETLQTKDK